MRTQKRPVHVTAREFYSSLAAVWMYMMLVAAILLGRGSRLSLMLIFGVSSVAAIGYVVKSTLSPRAEEADERPRDPPDGMSG